MLQPKWIRSTHATDEPHLSGYHAAGPVVTSEQVFATNGQDGIVAYKRSSGQQQWRLRVPHGVSSTPSISGNKLFFGANDGQFYCVDAMTGNVAWTFPLRSEGLASPLNDSGIVYVLAGNNTLYALAEDTGRQIWTHTRTETTPLSIRAGCKPSIHDKTLYAGFADGFLVALSAKDGEVIWERQLNGSPRFRDVDASPLIVDDRIYIATYDSGFFALSRKDGQVLWRLEEGGVTAATVDRDRIYFSTSLGHVLALAKDSGKELWRKKIQGGIATQPVLNKGLLFFGESAGMVRVWKALDGGEVASYDPGRGVGATPILDVKTDEVFVTSNQGNLHVLQLASERVGEGPAWQRR